MTVTLIKWNRISTLSLPDKVEGQFWLQDKDGEGETRGLLRIEGVDERWVLKSDADAQLTVREGEEMRPVASLPLETLNIYEVLLGEENTTAFVYCEGNTADRRHYFKYVVAQPCRVTVGRSADNDIVYENRFVSAAHAYLHWDGSAWAIEDSGSGNGTFVNSLRATKGPLHPGDVVYIMGLKLIVGHAFLALNNPDGQVRLRSGTLAPYLPQQPPEAPAEDDKKLPEEEFFFRSPRFKRNVERTLISVDSPPQNESGGDMPIMMTMGPSLTMGMASMSTAIFSINNALTTGNISAALPSIVTSGSMLLGSMLWPVVSKTYTRRRKEKMEQERQLKYRDYLDRVAVQFAEEIAEQEEILRENYVSVDECAARIANVERDLWERLQSQDDFLELRVGTGSLPLFADIAYSERKFSVNNDHLEEELHTLCERPKELKNVPITLSLYQDYICGVIGPRACLLQMAKTLVFQIATYYSYDEVKLVFLYDERDDFEFVKWLPHVWGEGRNIRLLATNMIEAKEVSAYLERELEVRLTGSGNEGVVRASQYYVVFMLNRELAGKTEFVKQVLAQKANCNFSLLAFYDELRYLPKECTSVIELEEGAGKIYDREDMTGQMLPFVPEPPAQTPALAMSTKLANIRLDNLQSSLGLPAMITFLELFGVGKVEHLNPLVRWQQNDPTKTLEVPVGVDTGGDLFMLDLHEKYHGPHGLVAGMTGSGKSEFIITYILSLAVNYHPHEVAFILIDYKGGGMAKAFEKLPHTAGIITNLDGKAVKRSLVSIESELKRRQSIFMETSKKVEVSNIDIYKYQKLYRDGAVDEPLQHLFIISDEFAELKTQQPEFMAQLISAARIGRSLGVHLILATQKPSGVVDDQIWSNSKFRVCLKVQERADSMDMLKRDDAANLVETGRFYLQVGYNELFELGQSAWAGAPYYPSEKVVQEKETSVAVLDRMGKTVKYAKMDAKKSLDKNPPKQLDAITEYLQKIAADEGIRVQPLWMEPLPPVILLEELEKTYPEQDNVPFVLNPLIGEYDDPMHQCRHPLHLPLTGEGNTLVYGVTGGGKTSFLNAMLVSTMTHHTPDEVNIYLLDFASETLRAFAGAPHVGDVMLSHETEKITNLLRFLNREAERRKKLFSDFGGDYKAYVAAAQPPLPNILVAINNYAGFMELFPAAEDALYTLTREGIKYGIYFVLTAPGMNAVRYRMQQNFKQTFVLQLNDEGDYSSIVGRTDGLFPARCKGRGLVKLDAIYELQVAQVTADAVPYGFIQTLSDRLRQQWQGKGARRIPVLPASVDLAFLDEHIHETGSMAAVPIGVGKASLELRAYPFEGRYIHQVLAEDKGYTPFIGLLGPLLRKHYAKQVLFFDVDAECPEAQSEGVEYASSPAEVGALVDTLFAMVLQRNNTTKEAMDKGQALPVFDRVVVIIQSLKALQGALQGQQGEKLALALEKGDRRYNVSVVVADTVKNMSGFTYEKWYTAHIAPNEGIWLGGGITDQYVLKVGKAIREMREDVEEGFGFVVLKGKPEYVKLLGAVQEGGV